MAALELVILVLMSFLVLAECIAVGYDCRDPCIGTGNYSLISPLSSGIQHRIDHSGTAQ